MTRIFSLAILALSFTSNSIKASECVNSVTPCEAYADAAVVFVGKVKVISLEFTCREQTEDYYDQTSHIAIERIYKGFKRTCDAVVT